MESSEPADDEEPKSKSSEPETTPPSSETLPIPSGVEEVSRSPETTLEAVPPSQPGRGSATVRISTVLYFMHVGWLSKAIDCL